MTTAAPSTAQSAPVAHAEGEILNPRTGQSMRFLPPWDRDGGPLLRIETVNPPTGESGHEPEHVHVVQESRARVLSGRLMFVVDGQRREVGPGEEIVIPANTPHYFWNPGPGDAHAVQEFRPALNTRRFFETYFRLAELGRLGKDGTPRLLQLAVLVPTYGQEARLVRPPWRVVRLIGLLAPLARALGYKDRYG